MIRAGHYLERRNIKRKTESLLKAEHNEAVRTNSIKVKIDKTERYAKIDNIEKYAETDNTKTYAKIDNTEKYAKMIWKSRQN